MSRHTQKHTVRNVVRKHCGKGGLNNPLIDTQTRDLGNLGKFTPTASTLPLASQQVKKSTGVKNPLQALTDPVNQSLKNIIRKKSSFKEFNMSGVNPSFVPRKGGFAKQPTGNSYLN